MLVNIGAFIGQKGVSDLLELELQVVGNHVTWVLGTKLGSSERITSTLNHEAVFPVRFVVVISIKLVELWRCTSSNPVLERQVDL